VAKKKGGLRNVSDLGAKGEKQFLQTKKKQPNLPKENTKSKCRELNGPRKESTPRPAKNNKPQKPAPK